MRNLQPPKWYKMSLALVLFPLDKQFLLDRQMTTNNKIMLDRWKLLSQNILDDTILTNTAMECQLAKKCVPPT